MVLKMTVLGHVITIMAILTIFVQCEVHTETIENGTENVQPMNTVHRVERGLYPEHAILAGELTPVFLAFHVGNAITYRRLHPKIVKFAFGYLKSQQFHTKERRNADPTVKSVENSSEPILHFNQLKQDANERTKFYYPSLLVVVEHRNEWPSNERAQKKLLYEKILYVLAYWNEVESQLRHIRGPGMRIRISGIVIGRDKAATLAVEYYTATGDFSPYWTLRETLKHWQRARSMSFFRKGTFNVVATMTDTLPGLLRGTGASARFTGCGTYTSEETWDLEDLTGLIVYDIGDFGSLNQAVGEFSHIMGRSATGVNAAVDAASFTDEDLKDIKRGLEKASCWKNPRGIYGPGKPVERLFRWDIDRS